MPKEVNTNECRIHCFFVIVLPPLYPHVLQNGSHAGYHELEITMVHHHDNALFKLFFGMDGKNIFSFSNVLLHEDKHRIRLCKFHFGGISNGAGFYYRSVCPASFWSIRTLPTFYLAFSHEIKEFSCYTFDVYTCSL